MKEELSSSVSRMLLRVNTRPRQKTGVRVVPNCSSWMRTCKIKDRMEEMT